MFFEEARRLDRTFIASVDEKDALAFEPDKRDVRHRHGGGGSECCHLRPRVRCFSGPAGGFPQIDETQVGPAFGGDLAKEWCFLRAADRDWDAR